jgi:hypothetical protein
MSWNEAVVAYFRYYLRIYIQEPSETMKILSQDSLCPVKDSNQVPPQYKSNAIPLHPNYYFPQYV